MRMNPHPAHRGMLPVLTFTQSAMACDLVQHSSRIGETQKFWDYLPLRDLTYDARVLGTFCRFYSGVESCPPPVAAGSLDDAAAAYERGDFTAAVQLFRPLADQGDVYARFNLGQMYAHGQGVSTNYAEAAKWYRLAANQGNARAQYSLGVVFAEGKGVQQSFDEAAKWYHLSASQGYAAAQYNLGILYAKGQGVSQDDVEAVKWYRKAADQGHAPAQANLGIVFAKGRGVQQDNAEALKWYSLAANQGDALGQNNLGTLYALGQGVSQDNVLAYMWFELSAARGFPGAIENRDIAAVSRPFVPARACASWFSSSTSAFS
jgi:TPR repeat protein